MTINYCETCNRPHHKSRSWLHQLVLSAGILLAILVILRVSTLRDTVTHLEKIVITETPKQQPVQQIQPTPQPKPKQPESPQPANKSRCEFPIVYNKPHKTASSSIQRDLLQWAHENNRPAYRCSPYINQATVQMRECIPDDSSGCAVVATHVVMSPTMTEILKKKIGDFRLITSTREPHDRLLSLYLQDRRIRAGKMFNVTDLKIWLKDINPWTLYNYHMGANRYGGCPLQEVEKLLIPDLVNRADIVVDANLYNVSNTILGKKRLFTLTLSKKNVRSSKKLVIDQEAEEMIKNATCVEEEMHRLYRLRMASLYQKAAGKRCLSDTRHPTPCF